MSSRKWLDISKSVVYIQKRKQVLWCGLMTEIKHDGNVQVFLLWIKGIPKASEGTLTFYFQIWFLCVCL